MTAHVERVRPEGLRVVGRCLRLGGDVMRL